MPLSVTRVVVRLRALDRGCALLKFCPCCIYLYSTGILLPSVHESESFVTRHFLIGFRFAWTVGHTVECTHSCKFVLSFALTLKVLLHTCSPSAFGCHEWSTGAVFHFFFSCLEHTTLQSTEFVNETENAMRFEQTIQLIIQAGPSVYRRMIFACWNLLLSAD